MWIALLPLEVAEHLRNRVLRRNAQQHVDMIGHQVPFLDSTLLLPRQLVEHLPQVPAQLSVERLAAIFRNEHNMVFAPPFGVIQTLVVHWQFSFRLALSGPPNRTKRLPELSNSRSLPGKAGGYHDLVK